MGSVPANLARLLEIMQRLRDPVHGCPWDQKQTFSSLIPYTLEEAYEVVDAIERGDFEALKAELGDLLLHVVFLAHLAHECDLFDFDGVAEAICEKLIRRHPHVFDNVQIESESELKAAWETHKSLERQAAANVNSPPSVMGGIAKALPELLRATKLQARAASVGFDWPDAREIFFKIDEELEEVQQVLVHDEESDRLQEEIGDVLFAVVNLSRHHGINPEQALRQGNRKFERRFRCIEQHLALRGLRPEECSLEELDALWEEVKRQEK